MKFEELSEERKEQEIENLREINTEHNWWEYSLEDICGQIEEKTKIELEGVDLMFDFFRKGHSGVWTDGDTLTRAISDKYPNLEDLDISKEFGVWAYIGLRQDEIENDDIWLYEEDEEVDDLTKLLQDKQDEQTKDNIIDDISEILDIFSKGYNSLYEEYDYLTSDKGIIETIEANDMEFENEN